MSYLNITIMFLLAGIFCLTSGINQAKKIFILFGFIFLGITLYTYQAGPFDSLIFLLSILLLNIQFFKKNKPILLIGLVTYTILCLPFLYTSLFEPQLLARVSRISTFYSGINPWSIKLFLSNYFSHWNLNFLFISGDPNLRQGAQTGVLYWWMLPFILIGLFHIQKVISPKWISCLVIFWLIIFPLGGSLTNDGVPHATRTLIGAPIFSILTSIGLFLAYQKLKTILRSKMILNIYIYLFTIIVTLSLVIFLYRYYFIYPQVSAPFWQYGNKEIFDLVNQLAPQYQRACLENLDYWNTKPLIGYYLKNHDLQIIADTTDPRCLKPKTILVTANKIYNLNPVQTILSPQGKIIYYFYTK
jgi:hypothetical protein